MVLQNALGDLATEATLNTVAKEVTLNTVAKESTLVGVAREVTLASRASEATLALRASEITLVAVGAAVGAVAQETTQLTLAKDATVAKEITLATVAKEATLLTLGTELTLSGVAKDATVAKEITLATVAKESTLATLGTEVTLNTVAKDATVAKEITLATVAKETTLGTRASEATVATLGTELTLSSRASEANLSTRASEATLATRATESTLNQIRLLHSTANENDPNNTTITPLAAGGTFLGGWTDVSLHGSLFVYFTTDQPDAPNQIEWSSDGVTQNTVVGVTPITQVAEAGVYSGLIAINPPFFRDKFYRVRITNGATPQTYLNVIAGTGKFSGVGTQSPIVDPLTPLSVATLTRAVTAGSDPDGHFKNQNVQGRFTAGSTSTPLNGNATFRGQWFEWQEVYVGSSINLTSNVAGTLYVEFSQDAIPVNGNETSVDGTITCVYNPIVSGLFRRTFPVQSRWVRVRYVNGVTAQANFSLELAFLASSNVDTMVPLTDYPQQGAMATVTQSLGLLETANESNVFVHPTASLIGDRQATDVNVIAIGEAVVVKSQPTLVTGQGDVNGVTPNVYPASPLTNRATVRFTNTHPTLDAYYSESSAKVIAGNGDILLARQSIQLNLTESTSVYWYLASPGGTSNSQMCDAIANTAVVNVTNPEFSYSSNNTYAVFTALNSTETLSGITTPHTGTGLGEVRLQLEGRKAPTAPATLTSAHVSTQTAIAGNVTTIISPSITASTSSLYLVAVSYRNAAAVVSGMTGMGATWVQANVASGYLSESAIAVWYNTTPVTTTGTVTASFSAPITNCAIGVSRFNNASGVQTSAPLSSVSSSAAYSGSITGTALGMAYVAVNQVNRTVIPGNGFVEQADLNTGNNNNTDAGLEVSTLSLPSTGSQAYSGTLDGLASWSAVAVTLIPAPTVNPTVRVRYTVGVDPAVGPTTLTATLSSTSDTLFEASIFTDRAWTLAEVDTIKLIVDITALNGANAEIDRAGIYTTETTGANLVRLAFSQVGGAVA